MYSDIKKMTIDEFNNLKEDNSCTYELIDDVLCMTPRPNVRHQSIMNVLHLEIGTFLKGKGCKALTEVELEINNDVIVPDISVFCNFKTVDVQRLNDIPLLVIKILSPSNTAIEMDTKAYKYRNHGIKELWIVNPKTNSVEVKNLQNNTAITFIQTGLIKSNVFPDLKINVEEIFE